MRKDQPVKGLLHWRPRHHLLRLDIDHHDLVAAEAAVQDRGIAALRLDGNVDREVRDRDLMSGWGERPLVGQQHRAIRTLARQDARREALTGVAAWQGQPQQDRGCHQAQAEVRHRRNVVLRRVDVHGIASSGRWRRYGPGSPGKREVAGSADCEPCDRAMRPHRRETGTPSPVAFEQRHACSCANHEAAPPCWRSWQTTVCRGEHPGGGGFAQNRRHPTAGASRFGSRMTVIIRPQAFSLVDRPAQRIPVTEAGRRRPTRPLWDHRFSRLRWLE